MQPITTFISKTYKVTQNHRFPLPVCKRSGSFMICFSQKLNHSGWVSNIPYYLPVKLLNQNSIPPITSPSTTTMTPTKLTPAKSKPYQATPSKPCPTCNSSLPSTPSSTLANLTNVLSLSSTKTFLTPPWAF